MEEKKYDSRKDTMSHKKVAKLMLDFTALNV